MKKIYLIAIVVALLAGCCTYLFATTLEKESRYQDAEKVKVLYATQDIRTGTEITADIAKSSFEVREVVVDYTVPKYITNTEEVIGSVCTQEIFADEPLSKNMFLAASSEELGIAYDLNEGEVAYTIKAKDDIGVDGYLEVGDTVDIIAYYEEKITYDDQNIDFYNEKNVELNGDVDIKTGALNVPAFTDLEVLAVGSTQAYYDAEMEGLTDITSYETVTLRTTPEVAARIYNMEKATDEKFKLILKSHVDAERTRTENAEGAN